MEINKLYDSFFRITDIAKPYSSNKEYLNDLFSFLDLCFTIILSAKGIEGDEFPIRSAAGSASGLSVAATDIRNLILTRRKDIELDELTEEAKEQVYNAYFQIERRKRNSVKVGFIPPFEVLSEKFGLSEFEKFSLLLAFSIEYDRKYEGIFCYLHNNAEDFYPTKWLSIKLFNYFFGDGVAIGGFLNGNTDLDRFLCDYNTKNRNRGENAGRLTLSGMVSSYLLGNGPDMTKLSDYCFVIDAYSEEEHIHIRDEAFEFINRYFLYNGFSEKGNAVLNIYGPKGIGRKYMVSRAVASVGLKGLEIDLCKLIQSEESEIKKKLNTIYAYTVLSGTIACFEVSKEINETDSEGNLKKSHLSEKIIFAAEYIASVFKFCFWITLEKDSSFSRTKAEYMSIELPMLTANERKQFWDKYIDKKMLEENMDMTIYANQYILTPMGIKKSAVSAHSFAKIENGVITSDIISRSIKQHSTNQLGHYATLINAVFTWDDLVVSDDQKRKMQMICNQVKYRNVVDEDWGFRKKTPYGRGLCALFYGSPGTGKTMAVQVMANELGIDLYRIDLSQLTSKYIGETQKNISNLFNKAKNINAMLFFDEADSMFAKRSEVKDSNDRYANADTAFLLQKLEDYEGITILATNYVNNIDDAFKRRIKFMINFVFPTPEVRLMLWKKILPASAKVDETLDFEFFAENFELSGSNIKEILTNAAYLAASEGSGIKNCHIIEAVKLNFSKYGKILTNDDFGYLGQ